VLLQFYPSSSITLAYSVIEASIAISQIIAAPVAAGLLQLSGVWGLAGEAHRGLCCTAQSLPQPESPGQRHQFAYMGQGRGGQPRGGMGIVQDAPAADNQATVRANAAPLLFNVYVESERVCE
jgi:hypothetical protein